MLHAQELRYEKLGLEGNKNGYLGDQIVDGNTILNGFEANSL
jgi:hypothetical protein